MRRFNIAYITGCVAVVAASLQGCQTRTENIVNLNVITKPYSLHVSDTAGEIFSTNDGELIYPLHTSGTGPIEALGTTGKYRLMVPKSKSFLFVDDGGDGDYVNFNPVYGDLNPSAFGNTMFINLPAYNDTGAKVKDRLYVASSKGSGIAYSDENAQKDSTWYLESGPNLPAAPSATSFTLLDNGILVAFDDVTRKIYIKRDLQSPWDAMGASGLPPAGVGRMYIIHQSNSILAVKLDDAADNNIWRSTDEGKNFTKLPDLPVDDMTCAVAAFDKVIVVGTRANGVFRLAGQNTWEPTTNGLLANTRIEAMTFKTNKFKGEGREGNYIFIATNKGVYRSDDNGQSWIDIKAPSISQVFTAIE